MFWSVDRHFGDGCQSQVIWSEINHPVIIFIFLSWGTLFQHRDWRGPWPCVTRGTSPLACCAISPARWPANLSHHESRPWLAALAQIRPRTRAQMWVAAGRVALLLVWGTRQQRCLWADWPSSTWCVSWCWGWPCCWAMWPHSGTSLPKPTPAYGFPASMAPAATGLIILQMKVSPCHLPSHAASTRRTHS